MADEGGEKTELPTQKKLRDARDKGQVCTSKDVTSTAILTVLMSIVGVMAAALVDDVTDLLSLVGRSYDAEIHSSLNTVIVETVKIIFKHSFIFVLVAALIGIIGNMVQIGFLFTFEPIVPKLDKISPAAGFKRIFAMKNLFEFFKNCVKVGFLSYLIWKLMLASYPAMVEMCYGDIDDIFPVLAVIMKRLFAYTVFGYVVIAVVDRLFQQKNFTKEMMMTKDEVKREYKEMEGSQEVKQAQRDFRNELLNGPDPRQATKKASVVVTNPTHLAVGIRYDTDVSPLPQVVVKGADVDAALIRKIAFYEGIPIMEDVPLARKLYADVKVDEFIPVELVEPVAEILKTVKAMNDARKEQDELDSIQLD